MSAVCASTHVGVVVGGGAVVVVLAHWPIVPDARVQLFTYAGLHSAHTHTHVSHVSTCRYILWLSSAAASAAAVPAAAAPNCI